MADDNQQMNQTFYTNEEQTRRHSEDDEQDEEQTHQHSEDEQDIDQTVYCEEGDEQPNDDDLQSLVSPSPVYSDTRLCRKSTVAFV